MKHYPAPPPTRRIAPLKLPPFHAVPIRHRADGWTPRRQAEFIGFLAEIRSVSAAAKAVSMGRESAYRLRQRHGAEGFAAVWDIALSRRGSEAGWDAYFAAQDRARAALRPSRKVTIGELEWRIETGKWQVILRGGRYRGVRQMADNDALLALLRRTDAIEERMRRAEA